MNNIIKSIVVNATPLLLGSIIGGITVTVYRDYVTYKTLKINASSSITVMNTLLSELTSTIKELYGGSHKIIYRSEPIDAHYARPVATAPHYT